MFTDEYLIPGFYLVKKHQRIILHTLIFLLIASVLGVIGCLAGLVPAVLGFTLSGISIAELTLNQAVGLMGSDLIILLSSSVSFVLLCLNSFFWTSFYLGGVVQEVIEPKSQLVEGLKSAFKSVNLTMKPLMLVSFISLLSGFLGFSLGWGTWLLTNIWFIGSLFIFLGVTVGVLFLFLSSLTHIICNVERWGAVRSVKKSVLLVQDGGIDYFLLLITIIIANAFVFMIPLFGILISSITIPISTAALAGYYHVKGFESSEPVSEQEESIKPEPPSPPEEKKEKKKVESNEGTREKLDKILKEV